MGKKVPELNQKHWDALRLLSQGDKTIKAVATEVGWSADYLYDLVEGNVEKTGMSGELFAQELRKIDVNTAKKIKSLLKTNKFLALRLINDILHEFKNQKGLSVDEIKVLTKINNSLVKSTPNVEIGNLSYNYTKGLSAEELVYEFNRLKSIADGASNREAVSGSEQGGPGILPLPSKSGSRLKVEDEDSELSADGEAK